jgi:anti-anti-sigma factor
MASFPKSQINSVGRESEHQVVIDLSDLTCAHSAELSVLIKTLQRVQKCGVNIVLGGLQDNVRRIFEIKQLDRVFPIASRDEELEPTVGTVLSA